jgi:DNA polymerase
MSVLYLDAETFSDVPLKNGTHAYAEHAEILLTAYAWDDNPVDVLEEFNAAQIQSMIDDADTIVIHNSFFDRTVYGYCGVNIPVEKIEDTMVTAYAHSLPGGLDQLCSVLGVAEDMAKKKTGKKLINLFCKPRPKNMKMRRATKESHPEEWAQFIEYAGFDIISMREARRIMPRWNLTPKERELWILDQKINDRGIKVDMDLAHAALRAAARSQTLLAARIDKLTDGKVGSATQRAKLLEHLDDEHNCNLVDMTKGTVASELKGDKITDEVRELLEIRQQAAATSPAKYTVLTKAASTRDSRLRGTIQFCGAGRTHRFSGRLFQPHNLPRPTIRQDIIDIGIAAMKADCEDLIFDNSDEVKFATVMDLCASAVRGALISEDKKKLVVADLSNIEGRIVAWLAGEEWKIKAFAEFDRGVGFDIYVLAYSRAFGVTPEEVLYDKKHRLGLMRAIGKVMELSLQYGGAVGAFVTMGAGYGVTLPESEVVEIVQKWRRAHPAIKSFWYDLEWACRQAIRNKGEKFVAGRLEMDRVDMNGKKWLRIKAPSGSYLSYPCADERDDGQLVYDGTNQYTRQWEQLDTYGPKLLQNITEKVARDILCRGMQAAEKMGYEVCLHAHDELITEAPDDEKWNDKDLSGLMIKLASWMQGLPLAAAGFSATRYRKDQS